MSLYRINLSDFGKGMPLRGDYSKQRKLEMARKIKMSPQDMMKEYEEWMNKKKEREEMFKNKNIIM